MHYRGNTATVKHFLSHVGMACYRIGLSGSLTYVRGQRAASVGKVGNCAWGDVWYQ